MNLATLPITNPHFEPYTVFRRTTDYPCCCGQAETAEITNTMERILRAWKTRMENNGADQVLTWKTSPDVNSGQLVVTITPKELQAPKMPSMGEGKPIENPENPIRTIELGFLRERRTIYEEGSEDVLDMIGGSKLCRISYQLNTHGAPQVSCQHYYDTYYFGYVLDTSKKMV